MLQCAVIETQAYYDVYWQIPAKRAAAYNMLLDKFTYVNVQVDVTMTLHQDIADLLAYYNATERDDLQQPEIKETDITFFLSPPTNPSQHYRKSIQKICNQILNESLVEELTDMQIVFRTLHSLLKFKDIMEATVKPCNLGLNYPLWFSEGLVQLLENYQAGSIKLAVDYLTEVQINFISDSLKGKKQKNTSKDQLRDLETQQSQSQQNFYSKPRTKSILVSNWFHFKTYTNLRPRDTPAQIKRHKAVSCSQVDMPYSPQKQSPYNLKASIKPRWKCFSKIAQEALNARQKHINEQYQQYKESPKIFNPRKPEFVQKDRVAEMKKEAMAGIEEFQKHYQFDIKYNTAGLIKLLGKVSYVYDNSDLVRSAQFQEVIQSAQENVYQFDDIRELALLINFCFKHQVGTEELWFASFQHIQNNLKIVQIDDILLILQSINEANKQYFMPLFKMFENQILDEVGKQNHEITITALQLFRQYCPENVNFFYTVKKNIVDNLHEINTEVVIKYLRYFGLGNEPIEDRTEILNAIMIHLYKMHKFLTKKQLLQVYYIYVRTQSGSEILYNLIEDRVALLIDEFQLQEIEQLLIIAANQKNRIIFKHAEKLLKRRLLDTNPADMVEIAVLFIENNEGEESFIESLEQHLISAIYTAEDISELLWALVQKQHNNIWMEKIADACKERVPKLSVKQLTSIVWMTSDYFKRLTNKEKQASNYIELYESIEKKLIEIFEEGDVNNRDVAFVMNAYIRNLPIAAELVELMEIYILNSTEEELQELDGWSISQVVWGFSQISEYQNTKQILEFLLKTVISCIGEMKIDELFVVLRVYVNEKLDTKEMIKESIEKTDFWIDSLDLSQTYLGIHIFTNTQFVNIDGLEDLIKKLLKRLEFLKSIKPQSQEEEEIDHDKQYKLRLEVEKYKYH